MKTEQIKTDLRRKSKPRGPITPDMLLSSGSTLLNLACTGRTGGAFIKGKYFWFVGDSDTGKTFLTLTCFAEACLNRNFDGYRLIHDDPEGGALMDLTEFFGRGVAKRIEPPSKRGPSDTSEEFFDNVMTAAEAGKPFIYVLDSMDALEAREDEKAYKKNRNARAAGRDESGSYGTGKAKINSMMIRRLLKVLRRTKSILIVISQTRDKFGFGYEKSTHAGGRSLKFYSSMQIWTTLKEKLWVKSSKTGGQRIQTGVMVNIRTKKNRATGKDRQVQIPIYWSVGIDEVGSCVDYLISRGHWKKAGKGQYHARELGITATPETIVRMIEHNGEEKVLRLIVKDVWQQIEEASKVIRKKRYV